MQNWNEISADTEVAGRKPIKYFLPYYLILPVNFNYGHLKQIKPQHESSEGLKIFVTGWIFQRKTYLRFERFIILLEFRSGRMPKDFLCVKKSFFSGKNGWDS